MEMQRQVFECFANPPAADPHKKILESDPQFPIIRAKVRLRLVLECHDKIDQRNMSDRVAITFAKIDLGNSISGLICHGQDFAVWPSFVQFLSLRSTADWALYKETDQWRMNDDWSHYHSVVKTYKTFLPAELHPAHPWAGNDPGLDPFGPEPPSGPGPRGPPSPRPPHNLEDS